MAPQDLPPDTGCKGFTSWHTQDLRLHLERICFRRAKRLPRFRKECRDFYAELLAYRAVPSSAEAARLEARFGTLFRREISWSDLRRCLDRNRGNKGKVLPGLAHAELPLHDNAAELGTRRRGGNGMGAPGLAAGPSARRGTRSNGSVRRSASTGCASGPISRIGFSSVAPPRRLRS